VSDIVIPEQWQWSAAIREADGGLRLVGSIESDDETNAADPPWHDAKGRAMGHYRAWLEADYDAVLVRRPIAAWEVVDV
jgi:hypothetical protein